MSIQRRLDLVAAIVISLVVVGTLTYVFRDPLSVAAGLVRPECEPQPPASVPIAAAARGEVTIDSQRQQLIGVRTEAAQRGPVAPEIKASGVVRYDETRLAEVNVKAPRCTDRRPGRCRSRRRACRAQRDVRQECRSSARW